ncbi:unnamed protein product [Rotaria magnacalcarata]|uniref:Uncharacterized protein n=2 Tax=Rotaria magnacalcarata TaxID=392030 RepID=A0A815KZK7_9BILA|nr:unnamed protein product [Rotaria magnacalcarata]CAF1400641.1 unnamed protein product [Rotaria magnacalcarata]CAF4300672.1 unnamed protein product [Rotaria magnacalcarata]
MCKLVLQSNVPLGLADLGLLATVEPRTIHAYDKSRLVDRSADSETIRDSNKIMLMRFNQSIDPRPGYIRIIIIEWSIKSSIPVAHIVSPDTQRSLISARRCRGLYDYSQQTD